MLDVIFLQHKTINYLANEMILEHQQSTDQTTKGI
jgi:hypothetical protein